MLKMPDNILEYFFTEIKRNSKYTTIFEGRKVYLKPCEEQAYYKPIIIVDDIIALEEALVCFFRALNKFYGDKNILEDYHDLSFFFNNLLMNLTNSDAEDLVSFIYKRIEFFENKQFEELDEPRVLFVKNKVKYYAQRYLEFPGLETPYVLLFFMEKDGIYYNLPLIRYAFDADGTCYLFAVQFGKDRVENFDQSYKEIVNKVNTGINKKRNVSPSFVLALSLFTDLLREIGTSKILAPDYLCGRYRKYNGAQTVTKSNQILERILNNFLRLLERMEIQDEDFIIDAYPLTVDSYTHITLKGQRKELR